MTGTGGGVTGTGGVTGSGGGVTGTGGGEHGTGGVTGTGGGATGTGGAIGSGGRGGRGGTSGGGTGGAGGGTGIPIMCTPNQAGCDAANTVATCNASGNGFTDPRTDCQAAGQICGAGACAASFTDMIGETTGLGNGTPMPAFYEVNFIAVTSNRTLTQIQHYTSPAATAAISVVVFESTTKQGPYARIAAVNESVGSGTAYVSAAGLNVKLVAGRFYAIGIWWGPYQVSGLAGAYAAGSPNRPQVSFGTVFDAAGEMTTPTAAPTSITYTPTIANIPLYTQRLQTGP